MERATDLLEIIHTDVCGPMSVKAHGKYRYFLTFTDDLRSEERRVGKECRSRWSPYH